MIRVAGAADCDTFYVWQLAELPGRARANSRFQMKTVEAGGVVPLGGAAVTL